HARGRDRRFRAARRRVRARRSDRIQCRRQHGARRHRRHPRPRGDDGIPRLDRRPDHHRRGRARPRSARRAARNRRARPRDHARRGLPLDGGGGGSGRCARLARGMIAAPLPSAAALATHRPWTLVQARRALATGDFVVTDDSQPDQPTYHLVFTREQASALRRGRNGTFAFDGDAHDGYTDADPRVRFPLPARNGIVGFRGPPADTSQPSLPIRAAFYYAWYPEAWTRDAIFPYSLFHPTLGYYDADQATVVRHETDAMRYAHLDAGISSWWGRGGYPPTDERFWRYLAVARTTPLRWAIYYEPEGYGDPSVE